MGARRGAGGDARPDAGARDLKAIELKARQRLCAFLLRHSRVYRQGKSRWTKQHFRWLEEQKFEHPVQQVVFQEYVDTVMEARRRVASLEGQMREALQGWSLRPVAEALIALRGVDVVTGDDRAGRARGPHAL